LLPCSACDVAMVLFRSINSLNFPVETCITSVGGRCMFQFGSSPCNHVDCKAARQLASHVYCHRATSITYVKHANYTCSWHRPTCWGSHTPYFLMRVPHPHFIRKSQMLTTKTANSWSTEGYRAESFV